MIILALFFSKLFHKAPRTPWAFPELILKTLALPDLPRMEWCLTSQLPPQWPPAPDHWRSQDCSTTSDWRRSHWQARSHFQENILQAALGTPSLLHTDDSWCFRWPQRGKAASLTDTGLNLRLWLRTCQGTHPPASHQRAISNKWLPWRSRGPGWPKCPPNRTGCCLGRAPGLRWCHRKPFSLKTLPEVWQHMPVSCHWTPTLIWLKPQSCPKEECSRLHLCQPWPDMTVSQEVVSWPKCKPKGHKQQQKDNHYFNSTWYQKTWHMTQ